MCSINTYFSLAENNQFNLEKVKASPKISEGNEDNVEYAVRPGFKS